MSGFFAYPPRNGIFQRSDGQVGLDGDLVQFLDERLQVDGFRSLPEPAVSTLPPRGMSYEVPSETCGSTGPNLCLIAAFSNPLRRRETSALHSATLAGYGWVGSAGQSLDQAGRMPQRDALRTVGHDRAGPEIYLFGGICKKPQARSPGPLAHPPDRHDRYALQDREIGFKGLQEAIDTTTSGGKLILHIFGALAEFERDLIRERTRAGLEAARARGRKGGRPRALDAPKLALARKLYRDPSTTVRFICATLGISRATLYRSLVANDERARARD